MLGTCVADGAAARSGKKRQAAVGLGLEILAGSWGGVGREGNTWIGKAWTQSVPITLPLGIEVWTSQDHLKQATGKTLCAVIC